MRADQRRSLQRTILTAGVLLLSTSAVAAQTTYYGPGGDYLGPATFYDAKGNFVGSSVTSPGRSTNFFGRDGVKTARGGAWTAVQVGTILGRG
jgi:hypothetical protein